jgi:hypothetical protein
MQKKPPSFTCSADQRTIRPPGCTVVPSLSPVLRSPHLTGPRPDAFPKMDPFRLCPLLLRPGCGSRGAGKPTGQSSGRKDAAALPRGRMDQQKRGLRDARGRHRPEGRPDSKAKKDECRCERLYADASPLSGLRAHDSGDARRGCSGRVALTRQGDRMVPREDSPREGPKASVPPSPIVSLAGRDEQSFRMLAFEF